MFRERPSLSLTLEPRRRRVNDLTDFPRDIKWFNTRRCPNELSLERTSTLRNHSNSTSELAEASEVLPDGGLTELFGSGAYKRAETGKC